MKLIFDLDGTVTAEETLPLIARHFKIETEISNLTKETIQGNVPFIESFIRRVHLLEELPVSDVSNLLEQIALHPKVYKFIQTHKKDCIIATGNLDCWVEKLANRIDCPCYTSKAKVENNKVVSIEKILNKEQVVKRYQELGEKVTFVGDGNNDMEAMRIADVAIASGLTHHPANSIMAFADYLIFDEEALCRQLNQLF